MNPGFGARLRLQREQHQVALAAIAEQTKIKISLLDGLERGDVSHWPGGVFRRAYVRAYAQAIGLEPDTVLREFLEVFPDPVEEVPTAVAAARGVGPESLKLRPPTRLRFLIDSALGALPTVRHQPDPSRGGGAVERVAAVDEGSWRDTRPVRVDGDRMTLAEAHDHADSGVGTESQPFQLGALPGASYADVADEASVRSAIQSGAGLSAVAELCTRLARANDPRELAPVLEDVVSLLDAVGLILWMWDPRASALRPALSRGYADEVVAQFPKVVLRETDNAIAAAFRSSETRVVAGTNLETGAVVVPLTTPNGAAGVLALELRNGGERQEYVRAFAEILAAQLSTLVGYPPLAHAATA